MLCKLALSGLKSKLQDYIVLLMGLVMSIAIFYMFQTLALNKVFIEANSIIDWIQFIFHAGSVLLASITFFYVVYANSFLLSLRQKEFGMYMMLGAKKYKVIILMFIETIVLGVASLVIGVTIGIGLAQGIGKLLMQQLEFTAGGYQAFYMPSMIVTCIFFLVLFILSGIMNIIKLSRITVLQLFHVGSQVDRTSLKGRYIVFVAFFAIVLLTIGYAAMIHMNQLKQAGIIIALFTVTFGTYLLFGAFLPFVIKKFKNNENQIEKGLNAFTFAQLIFRINSLTKILATVAMLVALGVGAISSGMAFKNNVLPLTEIIQPYDVVIHTPTIEEKKLLNTITFKEKKVYHYKTDGTFVYYVKEELEQNRPMIPDYSNNSGKTVSEAPKTGESLSEEWQKAFNFIQPPYVSQNQKINIVNKKRYDHIQAKERIVLLGTSDSFLRYKEKWKKLDELEFAKYPYTKSLQSKYVTYTGLEGMFSGVIFMGFFLGIAFLTMMASCLMFKILTGASSDIPRYQMLRKIGVRRELLRISIYKEFFFVFLFPAIVGVLHVIVGMNIFQGIVLNPYFRIWLPILIFAGIYVVYYWITVQLYQKIVLPKEE
ncbi:ABC transporter permease [Bacillus cereus VD196]|uniref:ABC transporter permease n=1 Tax=Bacillus cereus VD196 TaxID=1053243 RepID=A0A9W5PY55_BACCE|nr:ABC transporter permease [Bacillus cereus]EOO60117.1 ABC transporter permease [Bacillus cereus VD196]